MTTVRIHPRFVIPYYSLYLEGLTRLYGAGSLQFTRSGLPDATQYNDGFAFTVETTASTHKKLSRFYVSANDFTRYDQVALAWCDRYGMVNVDPAQPRPDKVVALGPSFGIRQWGSLAGTYRDVARIFAQRPYPPLELFRKLRAMRKYFFERLPEEALVPGSPRDGYVFYVAWPWQKHPEVNPPRARFMRACRAAPGLDFEGGFSPRKNGALPELNDITATRHYPFRDWLRRTQASALVFNNAAVHGCLGWKLGEFLALGKAIVSLPLTRSMPADVVHGEHLHFVEDDSSAMTEAVSRLLGDSAYRKSLEKGARRYYAEHLMPQRVVARLVSGP